jgi:hypothetical protein
LPFTKSPATRGNCAFVKEQGINYPVARTSVAVCLAYGGIAALPSLFVINQDSKVVQKHMGLFNPALYELERARC